MRAHRLCAAAAGILVLAGLAAPTAAGKGASAPSGGSHTEALAPTGDRVLDDIAYGGEQDAWAVGWRSPSYAERYAAILHWNGAEWSTVETPPTGKGLAGLGGVGLITADDVWAVGVAHGYFEGSSSTLAMHWDGASWTIVRTPRHAFDSGLDDVSGSASNDVWAVGATRPSLDDFYQPLIEHWDGATWTTFPVPDLPAAALTDVAAVAPDDVWAVGFGPSKAVALHYDGTQWRVVHVPEPGGSNQFRSISVRASGDAWAVGLYFAHGGGQQVLVEHWNGVRWKVVEAPSPGETGNKLMAVDARGPSDVWAVGSTSSRSSYQTLIEHWDGSSWQQVPSPPHSGEPELEAVAGLAADDVLAVGGVLDSRGGLRPIVERWDGQRWHKSPPHWN